jgi:hypothetical protein
LEEVNIKAKLIGYSIGALFLLVLFIPSGSACLFKLTPNLIISYDTSQTQEVITPLEDTFNIDIFVYYQVTGPATRFGSIPENMDLTTDVYIDLEIDNATLPDFVSASITPNLISADISQELTRAKQQVILFVKVDENAPAFLDFSIKIKATARETSSRFGLVTIDSITTSAEVFMQPNFVPSISVSEPEGNQFNISSNNQAKIPINVTNLGNGRTLIDFELLNEPKYWTLNIQESVILEVGEETTVYLHVKPDDKPNQRHVIQLRITPSYYRDKSLSGDSYTLNFTVTSKGILPEEINIVIILLIFLIPVILFVFYVYYKTRPN